MGRRARSRSLPSQTISWQGADVLGAHAPGHAPGRAEQIGQHRHAGLGAVVPRVLEQQGQAAGVQDAVADLGHFEMGRDGGGDALEFLPFFELGNEIPQIFVFHKYLMNQGFVCVAGSGFSGFQCSSVVSGCEFPIVPATRGKTGKRRFLSTNSGIYCYIFLKSLWLTCLAHFTSTQEVS
jgi:hypothetical protein